MPELTGFIRCQKTSHFCADAFCPPEMILGQGTSPAHTLSSGVSKSSSSFLNPTLTVAQLVEKPRCYQVTYTPTSIEFSSLHLKGWLMTSKHVSRLLLEPPCNPSRSTLILKQECLSFPHCRPLDSPVKSATLTGKINFSSFYKAAKSQRLLEANAGSGEQLHGLCSTEQHPERKAKGPSLTLGWGELL